MIITHQIISSTNVLQGFNHFEKETYLIIKVKNFYNMAFGVKENSLKVRAIELKM